jgi:protein O-GlcNAc transferase
MNILMINKGDTGGGGYKVVWDLANGLLAAGHKVNLLVQEKRTSSERVGIIPRSSWRFYLSHLLGTDFDFFKTDFILETEAFKQADIVHIHNIHSHYFNLKTLGKICRLKPTVWTFHDLWPVTAYCPHPTDLTLHRGFYYCPSFATRSIFKKINQAYLTYRKRSLYKKIKFNIAVPSAYMLKMLQATAVAGWPTDLIYNGIDTDVFKPGNKVAARQRLNLPPAKKIFLFIANKGRTNSWKGWRYFSAVADYFADNDDILFLCIGGRGDGPRPNVSYLDFINDQEHLADYYVAADGLIFASLAESFGLVVAEAMSCGLPVIAFNVGIVGEAINHKQNGYLAERGQGQGQALIKGVEYVLSLSDRQLSAMAQLNRRDALSKFDKKDMVKAYMALYDQVVNTHD